MTRTEARQYLIAHLKPHYAQGDTKWEEAMSMAIDVLSQRWIPCKERLPEANQTVLVCGICGDEYVYTHRRFNDTSRGWEDDYGYFHPIHDVTAWMPLPEPAPQPFNGGTDA